MRIPYIINDQQYRLTSVKMMIRVRAGRRTGLIKKNALSGDPR